MVHRSLSYLQAITTDHYCDDFRRLGEKQDCLSVTSLAGRLTQEECENITADELGDSTKTQALLRLEIQTGGFLIRRIVLSSLLHLESG